MQAMSLSWNALWNHVLGGPKQLWWIRLRSARMKDGRDTYEVNLKGVAGPSLGRALALAPLASPSLHNVDMANAPITSNAILVLA